MRETTNQIAGQSQSYQAGRQLESIGGDGEGDMKNTDVMADRAADARASYERNRFKEGPGRVARNCELCGNSFTVRLSQFKQGKGRFCSKSCRGKNPECHQKDQHGEKNTNWKGGITANKSAYVRRFEAKYPEKARAQTLLRQAVRCGKVQREPCSVCGSTERVHGHHEDYSKPLEVEWLCGKHHRMRHGASC